jgi:putative nucleotidyltransferase with HDIG domain
MNSARILLVDDEANILAALTRTFHGEGYEIQTAPSGTDALRLMEAQPPDLVVSDHHMLDMSGVELLRQVKERFPETVRILLTGHADLHAATDAVNQSQVYRFLTKPWNNDDLKATIRQALHQKDLERQNARLAQTVSEQNSELRALNADLEKKVEERTAEVKKLFTDLQAHFVQSVKVFVELVSLRAANLAGHSKRVAAYSKAVARQLGLDQQRVFEIEIAAVLHDIGKIGMPEAVVDWTVPMLSASEEALLKEHPVLGQKVIRPISELEAVARLVRSHHERFDGRGFPDKLGRGDIPLGSRIIAIADALDRAMHSRKFGERMPKELALELLDRRRGYDFDPELVGAFLSFARARQESQELPAEVKTGLEDLCAGMVTARDVRTASGILLVPKGETLTDNDVRRLVSHDKVDPIVSGVFVLSTPVHAG